MIEKYLVTTLPVSFSIDVNCLYLSDHFQQDLNGLALVSSLYYSFLTEIHWGMVKAKGHWLSVGANLDAASEIVF